MEEWLIVDGYNVIGAQPNGWSSFPLEEARYQLVMLLSEYQSATGRRVILVFDAHRAPGGETKETEQQVTVYFTREQETADQFIERLVKRLRKPDRRIYVATSDYLEQRLVFGQGAYRMSARELWKELEQMKREVRREMEENRYRRPTLGQELAGEILRTFEKWRRKK